MPAKAPIDENVKFLFACLIRSDYKTIDFTRVAADFSINPAAARMRWSRLKKTINVDDIASSVLDGKKRRTARAGKVRASPPSSSSSVKVEKVEDGASQLPPPSGSAVGITLKEEEGDEEGEVELTSQEEVTPVLFAGLPKPPKCRGAGAEEQVSIPVVDVAARAVGRFAATQVPHLPRVAEAAAVEAPETGSQPPVPQKSPPAAVVQGPPTLKSELKQQPGEVEEMEDKEEEGKPTKSEPPPTDTICENAGSAVVVVLTAANGSKKRKVEST
ncbi:hypothetical protein B9Z19DRAFT_1100871 [Tuber borchii]|uniref:Myb-like DNA-binding domain-containing protein n=1 Tax=Tuber borchii TaxID=42251 RepID=A0A2T6ZV22_TUBBO|nr:hypothetical protein B9Z19DRAFT_1100871 [Tuber borchii]